MYTFLLVFVIDLRAGFSCSFSIWVLYCVSLQDPNPEWSQMLKLQLSFLLIVIIHSVHNFLIDTSWGRKITESVDPVNSKETRNVCTAGGACQVRNLVMGAAAINIAKFQPHGADDMSLCSRSRLWTSPIPLIWPAGPHKLGTTVLWATVSFEILCASFLLYSCLFLV